MKDTLPPKRGDAARAALVETAERMFAERGIEAVSLRDVSAAAGQRNHSAAQYHFGDRGGLVAAVYEGRMRLVDAERYAYLDRLRDRGELDDPRRLVEAVVLPLVSVVAETDGWYGRFLARTRWDATAWTVLATTAPDSSFRTAVRRLSRVLSDLPPEIRRSRIDQLITLTIGTIAGWEGAPARGEQRLPVSVMSSDLVATGVALLTAPRVTNQPTLTGANR